MAILASGTPVALEMKGTVREARGLHSHEHVVAPNDELYVHEPDYSDGEANRLV